MTYYRNDTPQNFQTSCHKFIDNLGHSIILEVKIAIKCFGINYVYFVDCVLAGTELEIKFVDFVCWYLVGTHVGVRNKILYVVFYKICEF
jgi:hypothetical protein